MDQFTSFAFVGPFSWNHLSQDLRARKHAHARIYTQTARYTVVL